MLSGIGNSTVMTGATSGIVHTAENWSPRHPCASSPAVSVLQDTACARIQHKMLQDRDQNIHHIPVCLWKAFL